MAISKFLKVVALACGVEASVTESGGAGLESGVEQALNQEAALAPEERQRQMNQLGLTPAQQQAGQASLQAVRAALQGGGGNLAALAVEI